MKRAANFNWGVVLMNLDIPFDIVIAYAAGLALLYLVGWLLLVRFKFLLRWMLNGLLGGIALWVLNLIGGLIGVTMAINPVTALTVGFLGVPGVILILFLQFVLL